MQIASQSYPWTTGQSLYCYITLDSSYGEKCSVTIPQSYEPWQEDTICHQQICDKFAPKLCSRLASVDAFQMFRSIITVKHIFSLIRFYLAKLPALLHRKFIFTFLWCHAPRHDIRFTFPQSFQLRKQELQIASTYPSSAACLSASLGPYFVSGECICFYTVDSGATTRAEHIVRTSKAAFEKRVHIA